MGLEKGTVKVKGKDYKLVVKRVDEFRLKFKGYGIDTKIIDLGLESGVVVIEAKIKNPENQGVGSGHAEEKRNSSQITKTSALENCETSAIGRCLGFLNIGLNGIATADEVANAIHQQKPKPLTLKQAETILDLNQHEAIDGEFADRLDKWIQTDEERSYEEGEKVIKKMQLRIDEYDGLEN